jgi:hypothetical protein
VRARPETEGLPAAEKAVTSLASQPPPPRPEINSGRGRYSAAVAILATGFVICAIVVCVAYMVKRVVVAPVDAAGDLAKQVSAGIRELLNITPRVTINQVVVIHESYPSFELATVTREMTTTYEYRNQWLGSEKAITIKGRFRIKAGFDLNQSSSVDIDQKSLKITAKFPPPKILSMELLSHEIEKTENGYWNHLKPADQKEALDSLMHAAKAEGGSGISSEAKRNLEEKLRTIAEKNKTRIQVEYGK